MSISSTANVIRYSALPWIDFTILSLARMFAFKDSCPKFSLGKMTNMDGKRTLSISIRVYHSLVDGIDLGKFIECYKEFMNE